MFHSVFQVKHRAVLLSLMIRRPLVSSSRSVMASR
jgi:hypothetical protein